VEFGRSLLVAENKCICLLIYKYQIGKGRGPELGRGKGRGVSWPYIFEKSFYGVWATPMPELTFNPSS
jgi:hypothetical protein